MCIKYWINFSEAVVGVDWPMKVLFIVYTIIQETNVSHFVKLIFYHQTPSCTCSICIQCVGKDLDLFSKSRGRSCSARESTSIACTKAI